MSVDKEHEVKNVPLAHTACTVCSTVIVIFFLLLVHVPLHKNTRGLFKDVKTSNSILGGLTLDVGFIHSAQAHLQSLKEANSYSEQQAVISKMIHNYSTHVASTTTSVSITLELLFDVIELALLYGIGMNPPHTHTNLQTNIIQRSILDSNNISHLADFMTYCQVQTTELPSDTSATASESPSVLRVASAQWMDIMTQTTRQLLSGANASMTRRFGSVSWNHPTLQLSDLKQYRESLFNTVSGQNGSKQIPRTLMDSKILFNDFKQQLPYVTTPITTVGFEDLVLDERLLKSIVATTMQNVQNLIFKLTEHETVDAKDLESLLTSNHESSSVLEFDIHKKHKRYVSLKWCIWRLKYQLDLLKQASLTLMNYMLLHNGRLPPGLPPQHVIDTLRNEKQKENDLMLGGSNAKKMSISGGGFLAHVMVHSWKSLKKVIDTQLKKEQQQYAMRLWSFCMIECCRLSMLVDFGLYYFHFTAPSLFQAAFWNQPFIDVSMISPQYKSVGKTHLEVYSSGKYSGYTNIDYTRL